MIEGLAELGVLGMTAPVEFGGRGFSQQALLPDHGGHRRPLLLDGRVRQRPPLDRHPRACSSSARPSRRPSWLPPLTRGEKLAAFALTEEQAGSDASNVQTTATPSADGQTYVLNGTKRYITNGGIADVLTVMARTPDPTGGESKVTAFLVTPDMPGFEVVEARMPKCGIRGHRDGEARLPRHARPGARTSSGRWARG